MRNNSKFRFAGLAALAMFALSLPAAAEDAAPAATPAPATKPDPTAVVATVDGQPITQADLAAAFVQIGEQLQQRVPPQQISSALIEYIIDIRLSAEAAIAAGYDKDPSVAARLGVVHDAALYSDFFQRKITAAISDDVVKKKFDDELAKFVPTDEPHVFHILVKDEADAKAIIAQLDQGGDFAAIAKEKSIDTGSAASGGDLHFVPRGETVPEFEAAAYALKPGTYTKTPVQSKYGWHIIKVTETRKSEAPTLEGEREKIEADLAAAAVHEARVALRSGAKITYTNPPAAPAPDAAAPAGGDAAAPAAP